MFPIVDGKKERKKKLNGDKMILETICIIAILAAIISNAFMRNINGALGFSLALSNYIALQIELGKITF